MRSKLLERHPSPPWHRDKEYQDPWATISWRPGPIAGPILCPRDLLTLRHQTLTTNTGSMLCSSNGWGSTGINCVSRSTDRRFMKTLQITFSAREALQSDGRQL